MHLTIAAASYHHLLSHLRGCLPEEGCALLATVPAADGDRTVVRLFIGENIDHSPTHFTMHPDAVLAAFLEIDRHRWEFGVIVHSHPTSPPTLSPSDLREARYPGVWHLIVSFAGGGEAVSVWHLGTDGAVTAVELCVIAETC